MLSAALYASQKTQQHCELKTMQEKVIDDFLDNISAKIHKKN